MKSTRLWIDTLLLCSSTCLSLSSSRRHFPSPGKSAIFSTFREKRSWLAGERTRKSNVVNARSVKQYAKFLRFITWLWRLLQGWLDCLILALSFIIFFLSFSYDFLSASLTLISTWSRNLGPICISRSFCRGSSWRWLGKISKLEKFRSNNYLFVNIFKFRFNLKRRELYSHEPKNFKRKIVFKKFHVLKFCWILINFNFFKIYFRLNY